VCDVDAAVQPQPLDALEDELDLKGPSSAGSCRWMSTPTPWSADSASRASICPTGSRSIVAGSSPPMCSTPSRGAVEEGEYAGAAQHPSCGKADDLDGQRTVVGGDGLTHGLDAAQLEPQIDVDVRADRGGAVAHELLEDVAGDLVDGIPISSRWARS
jgi:hypothetical protein